VAGAPSDPRPKDGLRIVKMTAIGALSTARSALIAQGSAVAVAAENIVNVRTPGYVARLVDFTSLSRGGGEAGGVQALVRTPTVDAISQTQDADVDLGHEFSNLIQARTAYRAAAAVFSVADGLARESVDLTA